jgi:hypothetical protein
MLDRGFFGAILSVVALAGTKRPVKAEDGALDAS